LNATFDRCAFGFDWKPVSNIGSQEKHFLVSDEIASSNNG
jgi:hypothetical protein